MTSKLLLLALATTLTACGASGGNSSGMPGTSNSTGDASGSVTVGASQISTDQNGNITGPPAQCDSSGCTLTGDIEF